MKKRFLAMALTMAMTMSLAACGSDSGTNDTSNKQQSSENKQDGADSNASSGPIDLVLWGAEEDQDLLAERVEAFKAAYPDQTFNIQVGVESESTAKDTILTDIEAAADVFSFADDQLADLVDAGALLAIDDSMDQVLQTYAKKSLDDVKAANVDVAVDAATATKDGKLYAFPMSADNGYFLYYDSTVFSEEDVQTWDGLLAAAKKNGGGRKVGMTLSSGWYNAGFFYGAGFTTNRNDDGTTAIDWNGTSPDGITGVQVTKAMLDIAANSSFQALNDGESSSAIASGKLCAVVSGTWDAKAAKKVFKHKDGKETVDGYAATKLPTFTVDGQQIQTGSVGGSKLVGVNAHSKNSGWAVLLAEYLTNEESQIARFEAREIGPCNKNAQASDAVQENVALAAILQQSEFATIQRVGGKYWDPAQTFGEKIVQGKIKSDDASVQAALDDLITGVTAPIE